MISENNFPLKHHNTFGINVSCRRFVEFSTVSELQQFLSGMTPADEPLLLLGGGSNVLFTADYPATVLHSAIHGWSVSEDADGSVLLRVGSGEVWDDVVDLCVRNGWYGAENLSAIPGEVGASAVQNIGAYGVEVKDIIDSVEVVSIADGSLLTIPAAECQYAYRWSRFKGEWQGKYVVTHVIYRLSCEFCPRLDYGNIRARLDVEGIAAPTAADLRRVIIAIRDEKLPDPRVEGNAGSFFMNPVVSVDKYAALKADYPDMPSYPQPDGRVKVPAGWLIERCGWKGRSLGNAGVHSRQALVLVNRGGATGGDILALCDAVRKDVKRVFDIDIHPEVNIR